MRQNEDIYLHTSHVSCITVGNLGNAPSNNCNRLCNGKFHSSSHIEEEKYVGNKRHCQLNRVDGSKPEDTSQ